jgi:hypothetical protein
MDILKCIYVGKKRKGSFYVGQTDNPGRRESEHNKDGMDFAEVHYSSMMRRTAEDHLAAELNLANALAAAGFVMDNKAGMMKDPMDLLRQQPAPSVVQVLMHQASEQGRYQTRRDQYAWPGPALAAIAVVGQDMSGCTMPQADGCRAELDNKYIAELYADLRGQGRRALLAHLPLVKKLIATMAPQCAPEMLTENRILMRWDKMNRYHAECPWSNAESKAYPFIEQARESLLSGGAI